jgi:hypothetical protein
MDGASPGSRELNASRKGVEVWGEGASDLWGHLVDEEATCLKTVRKRLRGENSPTLDEEAEPDFLLTY